MKKITFFKVRCSLWRFIATLVISCIATSLHAGFETPQEQQKKMLTERLVRTKQYIDSIIGKTAWYNSTGCFTSPIYAERWHMSYNDATYKTDDKYVPITFLEAEVNQDTYQDYIVFKVKIDNKDEGFIEASDASKLEISDGWGCFKAQNPENKSVIAAKTGYSGSLRDWDIHCKKDKIDNKKVCSMWRDGLTVMMINGRYVIGVGKGDSYPGSKSAIKVDDNIAYFGRERIIDLMSTNTIIQQLKKGRTAHIRYREWPYDYDQSADVDLNGFTKKLIEMTDRYNKL
ncbi:hypothetical protein ACT4X4_10700 [Acinetobacter baumannii]|uniref:hypothetical protein n=1 Tax=Acinetobacter baumannii TaxID=470 RepID=UPI0038929FDD